MKSSVRNLLNCCISVIANSLIELRKTSQRKQHREPQVTAANKQPGNKGQKYQREECLRMLTKQFENQAHQAINEWYTFDLGTDAFRSISTLTTRICAAHKLNELDQSPSQLASSNSLFITRRPLRRSPTSSLLLRWPAATAFRTIRLILSFTLGL